MWFADCLPPPIKNPGFAYQRWSPRGRPWPRGHILKSLALASKPQVLENCPVLGWRTALFLNRWNFVGKRQKPCENSAKTFFLVSSSRDSLKKFLKTFFAWKKFLKTLFFRTLASVSLVLGLERACAWPWPRNCFVPLASSLVSSTPPMSPMPEFKKLLSLVIFFSTNQKTMLSSSRRQDIFEDL